MNLRYNLNLHTTVAFCTSTTRLDFYNIKKEWGVGWRALRCQGPVTTTLYWGPVFLNGARVGDRFVVQSVRSDTLLLHDKYNSILFNAMLLSS